LSMRCGQEAVDLMTAFLGSDLDSFEGFEDQALRINERASALRSLNDTTIEDSVLDSEWEDWNSSHPVLKSGISVDTGSDCKKSFTTNCQDLDGDGVIENDYVYN
jgi:hypothetical protein